jgi:hypothetical protein
LNLQLLTQAIERKVLQRPGNGDPGVVHHATERTDILRYRGQLLRIGDIQLDPLEPWGTGVPARRITRT